MGIVAASGLWITFVSVYTYSRLYDVNGRMLLLHYVPAQTALGIYAFILALAFILNRPTDAEDRTPPFEP